MGGCSWCRVGLGNPYSTRCVTALPYLRIVLSRPASSPYFGEGIAEGKALYARRKVIVEPVFGQIKEARGFRRFLLRGLEKIRGDWRLVCLTHNLLKVWRYGSAQSAT